MNKKLVRTAPVILSTAFVFASLLIFGWRHLVVDLSLRSQRTIPQTVMAEVTEKHISLNPFEGYSVEVQGKDLGQKTIFLGVKEFTRAQKGQKICIAYDLNPIQNAKPAPYQVENVRICSREESQGEAYKARSRRIAECPIIGEPVSDSGNKSVKFSFAPDIQDSASALVYRLHLKSFTDEFSCDDKRIQDIAEAINDVNIKEYWEARGDNSQHWAEVSQRSREELIFFGIKNNDDAKNFLKNNGGSR